MQVVAVITYVRYVTVRPYAHASQKKDNDADSVKGKWEWKKIRREET
jgi:hypothetical protein